jgi:hybrid cluster-associated redox disulfide protein
MLISSQSTVSAVMATRPETVAVFVRHRMHCPGCVMARFMTLAEAAENHGVDADELVSELQAAAPVGRDGVP